MSPDQRRITDSRSIPIVKVVVAGDGRVGKTSLIRRHSAGMFQESRVMTIGVDFQTAIVKLDDRSVKLSIWDIAGQDRFGSFRDSFYRGAQAVALVYDVTDLISMNNVPRWQAEIQRVVPKARFMLVGNKIDLHRVVPHAQVAAWARLKGFPYVETSAVTAAGVDEFFGTLARLAFQAS
jgi:small GTP-binding protein